MKSFTKYYSIYNKIDWYTFKLEMQGLTLKRDLIIEMLMAYI
jgi:hypothetical protein